MTSRSGEETETAEGVDRRVFLGLFAGGIGGAALVGGTAAAAWPKDPLASPAPVASTSTTDMGMPAGGGPAETDADMNAMHKDRIDQFLENAASPITKGVGATELAWEMVDGVRCDVPGHEAAGMKGTLTVE